jgi:hypothetical protein
MNVQVNLCLVLLGFLLGRDDFDPCCLRRIVKLAACLQLSQKLLSIYLGLTDQQGSRYRL